MWTILLRSDYGALASAKGGVKGERDSRGRVDLGCSIQEEHQLQGYVAELVRAIFTWALEPGCVSCWARDRPQCALIRPGLGEA